MDGGSVAALTQSLRDGVDELLSADLSALPSDDVPALLRELETQRRRLAAVDHRVIGELTERGLAGDYGATSAADLLVRLLRVTPVEAAARAAQARDLGPRRAMSGEPLPPILPATADAVRAGEISTGHVSVISKTLDRIPPETAYEVAPVAERFLLQAARHEHPKALARTAELLMLRLDPDGKAPREEENERRRDLSLRPHADGSADLRGYLTAECAEALRTVLDPLSAPAPADDAVPDTRSAGQRRHDAVHDMANRLLRSQDLPAAGGAPATILLTATAAELRRASCASTCDADVVPVILNEAGGILAYGRTRRLASKGQRLALIARDRGCCFPGCDRPAAWTEVHHIHEWLAGGGTDIDNLCLLCRYHHRHFGQAGWQVRMSSDGVPEWLPPSFVDPQRRPARNTAHHPPEFDFQQRAAPT